MMMRRKIADSVLQQSAFARYQKLVHCNGVSDTGQYRLSAQKPAPITHAKARIPGRCDRVRRRSSAEKKNDRPTERASSRCAPRLPVTQKKFWNEWEEQENVAEVVRDAFAKKRKQIIRSQQLEKSPKRSFSKFNLGRWSGFGLGTSGYIKVD